MIETVLSLPPPGGTEGGSWGSLLCQRKLHLTPNVRAGAAHVCGEAAGLAHPVVSLLAPVLQHVGGDGEGHLAAFTGGEGELLEALQLLDGAEDGGLTGGLRPEECVRMKTLQTHALPLRGLPLT